MISGNHLADQSDKDQNDADRCPTCRRHMEEVDWCEENKEKCDYCEGDDNSVDCCITKLYCHHCQIAVDID